MPKNIWQMSKASAIIIMYVHIYLCTVTYCYRNSYQAEPMSKWVTERTGVQVTTLWRTVLLVCVCVWKLAVILDNTASSMDVVYVHWYVFCDTAKKNGTQDLLPFQ